MNRFLDKEYILNNGTDFENLVYEYCSDRMLDGEEEDGGKLFTGLAYELDDDKNLIYYGYYVDGFEEGERVYFYSNGNVESTSTMLRGRLFGEMLTYYEDGRIKSLSYAEYGVLLRKKEWNLDGEVIYEKDEPSKREIEMRDENEKWHKRITKEQGNRT